MELSIELSILFSEYERYLDNLLDNLLVICGGKETIVTN